MNEIEYYFVNLILVFKKNKKNVLYFFYFHWFYFYFRDVISETNRNSRIHNTSNIRFHAPDRNPSRLPTYFCRDVTNILVFCPGP